MSNRIAATIFLGVALSGCSLTLDLHQGQPCSPPALCPDGYRCIDQHCEKSPTPRCGDYVKDPGEACDDGPTPSPQCQYQTTRCQVCNASCELVPGTPGGTCGDGIIQKDGGEECDGTVFPADTSCSSYRAGTAGTVTCGSGCWIDYTACRDLSKCGNGQLDNAEACDPGNLQGNQCQTLNRDYTGGTLACASDCSAWDFSRCTPGPECGLCLDASGNPVTNECGTACSTQMECTSWVMDNGIDAGGAASDLFSQNNQSTWIVGSGPSAQVFYVGHNYNGAWYGPTAVSPVGNNRWPRIAMGGGGESVFGWTHIMPDSTQRFYLRRSDGGPVAGFNGSDTGDGLLGTATVGPVALLDLNWSDTAMTSEYGIVAVLPNGTLGAWSLVGTTLTPAPPLGVTGAAGPVTLTGFGWSDKYKWLVSWICGGRLCVAARGNAAGAPWTEVGAGSMTTGVSPPGVAVTTGAVAIDTANAAPRAFWSGTATGAAAYVPNRWYVAPAVGLPLPAAPRRIAISMLHGASAVAWEDSSSQVHLQYWEGTLRGWRGILGTECAGQAVHPNSFGNVEPWLDVEYTGTGNAMCLSYIQHTATAGSDRISAVCHYLQ